MQSPMLHPAAQDTYEEKQQYNLVSYSTVSSVEYLSRSNQFPSKVSASILLI